MKRSSAVGSGPLWQPTLGACLRDGRVDFRVWAPQRRRVEVVFDPDGPTPRATRLESCGDGMFAGAVDDVGAGDLYLYRLDDDGPFPDPCSRFQPKGVHGPSAVIDPGQFHWSDQEWTGVPIERAVIYELHVGTFTPAGTFSGVTQRLPELAELGVTVVELMPVADFPGTHNWGYDGASLFAPSHQYGTPDDLRQLVDAAHQLGLAVLLDVVYSHFGPDGAYAMAFSPFYKSSRHESPWGASVNLDGEHSAPVRRFFIENALYWLHEYHVDGLRLDATHWLVDDSTPHFMKELTTHVRESIAGRTVLLVAEDDRNLATIVRRAEQDGWGLDAVWADDFHHQVRCLAAGDRDGYYRDYSGSILDLAATIRHGWFYCGQYSEYAGTPRGTSPAGLPLERMIVCLQNHDQIGNRPFGSRLHHHIDSATFRALSAVLLFVPETPLLFMGQEWAASTPFLYFTSHHDELGRLVTEGRRAEFSRFEAFADAETRARIPDAQAASTFDASRLVWDERTVPSHAAVLTLYRALLRIRRTEKTFEPGHRFEVIALEDGGLVLARGDETGGMLLLVAWLRGSGTYDHERAGSRLPDDRWTIVASTEEPAFQPDPAFALPPDVELEGSLRVRFHRPSAVILRRE